MSKNTLPFGFAPSPPPVKSCSEVYVQLLPEGVILKTLPGPLFAPSHYVVP